MGLSENNNTTNVLLSPRPYNSMHIVKSFLISQLCQSGYLTYHCLCHNYLMDLQHSHQIFLNKQEKRRKKSQYLQCTFIYPLQISDCKHCFANQSYELHLSVIDSQLYLIHLKICITELKINITDMKLSTIRTYPQRI